ncbi:N-alpha-acetyltransferase 50, NatE catalytic subunit-like protein [Hyaloraphidium curvatum]|nr:N-alpha-acetyltransferase 50, NatE catalytic subunit-like protein [Hyaloraphidium curvatum]
MTSDPPSSSADAAKPTANGHVPSPHVKITLGDLTANNLKQLQTINSVVFPVRYGDKFYKDALEAGEFAKLAYMNDVCVGGIVGKREPVPGAQKTRLNILTIAVLAPYRRLGVGQRLLDHAVSVSASDKRISEVAVHVAVSNDDGRRFYSRNGFEERETVEGFYKEREVSPPDAVLMVRDVTGAKQQAVAS